MCGQNCWSQLQCDAQNIPHTQFKHWRMHLYRCMLKHRKTIITAYIVRWINNCGNENCESPCTYATHCMWHERPRSNFTCVLCTDAAAKPPYMINLNIYTYIYIMQSGFEQRYSAWWWTVQNDKDLCKHMRESNITPDFAMLGQRCRCMEELRCRYRCM